MRIDKEEKSISGRLTVSAPYCNDETEYISITVDDPNSGLRVMEVKIDYAEFTKALMKLSMRPCSIILNNSDKIGKKMTHKVFEFKLPKEANYGNRKKIALDQIQKVCPEDWEPDLYFDSQNSFFEEDNEQWARCTIRKWV